MSKKLTIILALCWISLFIAGGIWLRERPWRPLLTWQSPLPTATPAGPTPIPTPEFCISQQHDCILLEFLGYQHNGDGTTTLRYRITNHCAERVEYFAIETGFWTRLAPADGATYQGDLCSHTVRWVDDQPSIPTQGLRFDGDNDAFKEGAAEVYTFTVRDFTPRSPNTGRVVAGKREYAFRLMLLDPTCEVGVWPTPRPTPTLTPAPFSPLPTPTSTPDGGVVLPTEPVVAQCVFGPPPGGMPPEEAIIPLDAYSFSEPQVVLTNTSPIGIQQWLPDSETLLVTRSTGKGSAAELINTKTGVISKSIGPNQSFKAPRWLPQDSTLIWSASATPNREAGYWLHSFDPPGERRLTDDWGSKHDISPTGQEFLFMSPPGGTQPLLWNQATKTLRALPVDLAAWRYQNGPIYPFQPFNVVWQPGSEKILFWDGTWLFLYDLSTNSGCEIRTSTFVATPFTFVQAAAWSPNGRYLLLKNTEYPLYTMTSGPHDLVLVLDTYTGEAIQYALGNSVYSFSWAPDNQTIAVVEKTERQIQMADGGLAYRTGMFLFNIHSGLQQQILPIYSATSEDGLAWSPDGAWLAFLGSSLDTNGKRGSGGVQVSRVTKLP